ncbi:hypothetical protein B296_00009459, partial [Ensete ventricosum]
NGKRSRTEDRYKSIFVNLRASLAPFPPSHGLRLGGYHNEARRPAERRRVPVG